MENLDTLDKTYRDAVIDLQKRTQVAVAAYHESETFIHLFRQHFLNGSRWIYHLDGSVSRSNWTYHTACSMLLACRDMNCRVEFEVAGRHDARVRNPFDDVIMYCEWEWDCNDIFGSGKELDKLIRSVAKNPIANALLLTYVDSEGFSPFLNRVFEEWSKATDAALYLMIPVLQRSESQEAVVSLRAVNLHRDSVICWAD